jgi:hypothetical protein
MIFVDINRALEKNLAEMSDFDQLMCFFNVKSKEGLRFLYENGGAVLKEAIKCYEEVIDDPLFEKYVEGIDIDFEKRVDDATQSLTLQLAEKDKIIEKLEKQSSEPSEKMIEKIFGMVLGMMAAKDAERDEKMAERDEKMAERYEKMLKMVIENKI